MAKCLCKDVLLALMDVGFLGTALCDENKTSTTTAIKDRLLGGKEVKQTNVTEQGDKTQVTQTRATLNAKGTLDTKEPTVMGSDIR